MRILLIISLLIFCSEIRGQKLIPAASISSHISYTGLYLNTTPALNFHQFEFYAGPKIALSETRIPTRGPVGVVTGFIFYTGCDCKLRGFVNLDYQYIAFRPPVGLEDRGRIQVHELHAGFGLSWKPATRLSFFSAIYAGAYLERWPGFYGSGPGSQTGFNNMVRVGFKYHLQP